MKKVTLFLFFTTIFISPAFTQSKKALDYDQLNRWLLITQRNISFDGQWLFAVESPYKGDGKIEIISSDAKKRYEFARGYSAKFSPSSKYIAFKVKPEYQKVRELKIKKVKKSKMPKDSLFIFLPSKNKIYKYDKIKSYQIPKNSGSFMIAMQYPPKDTTKRKSKDKIKKYVLHIIEPAKNLDIEYSSVTEARISDNGQTIAFAKVISTKPLKYSIYLYYTDKDKTDSITEISGSIKKITLSPEGNYLAYLHSPDTTDTKTYSLFLYDIGNNVLDNVVSLGTQGIPDNWTVSENGKIFFSGDESKLFFGIAPKPQPEPKDTIPEDEKVKVDVWSWRDSVIMPQQLVNLDKDLKKTYLTVYHIKNKKVVRLQDKNISEVKLVNNNNCNYALGINSAPYIRTYSWDYPFYKEFYVINVNNGQKQLAVKKADNATLSPTGKYVVWYNHSDSCWYSYIVDRQKTVKLTDNTTSKFYDVENDVPAPADAYGMAGFTENDKYVLLYSRYDIWAVSPSGNKKPVNITSFIGKKNKIEFRAVDLNPQTEYFDKKDGIFLTAFNKVTKDAGYYKVSKIGKAPQKLIMSANYYGTPHKARNADIIFWQRTTVKDFPDIYTSTTDLKKIKKITNLNPQQKEYNWATVELVKWQTPYGEEEGLLYKPENFDPNKKYPVLVYFYERNSDNLHRYYILRPSRSIINPVFYASNGYVVFIPNIRYKIGYPGKSAYDYVVSGTLSLIEKYSWVDKDHIGLQGQSWGGYQTAYLITQTDMFAAAEAGAPVSNMTSAYGGIRWGSGMSREFQYEKTQSRIGGTLWDKLPQYMQNSPVFYAPNVKTPLLIMHNDNDGAVPWYQGIEMFMALRRLNKPVWLLNYNGQPHNLKANSPDCMDLTIRTKQFFDHYLKGKPMPYWMKYGIPATKKGKTLGYELVE